MSRTRKKGKGKAQNGIILHVDNILLLTRTCFGRREPGAILYKNIMYMSIYK